MSRGERATQVALPWVSFGSDAGVAWRRRALFLQSQPHPRAYGNFARLLGRYVRDEKLIPLEEAVRRLTCLPAENLGLADRGRWAGPGGRRGRLRPGHDRRPRHLRRAAAYATGVRHVLVNGVPCSPTASTPAPRPAASCAAAPGPGARAEVAAHRARCGTGDSLVAGIAVEQCACVKGARMDFNLRS